MRLTLNYAAIMAAGRDAGDASMRKAKRKKWNRTDWLIAAAVADRLFMLLAERS